MSKTIALLGTGQLGRRYLQGLGSSGIPLSVFVYDPSETALEQADTMLHDSYPNALLNVRYTADLSSIPQDVSLGIVATTSTVRPRVIEEVLGKISVQYWILEKVLAQSLQDLDRIASSVTQSHGVWVNTARRVYPWYQELSTQFRGRGPVHVTKTGHNWGLTCNGIHFVDLVQWWSGSRPTSVDATGIAEWYPSKRAGFHEAHGAIHVTYEDGSSLVLTDSEEYADTSLLYVETKDKSWTIDEKAGAATSSAGDSIPGRMMFQSELTAGIVDEILANGTCRLPTLDESIAAHRPYLAGIIASWAQWNGIKVTEGLRAPIT